MAMAKYSPLLQVYPLEYQMLESANDVICYCERQLIGRFEGDLCVLIISGHKCVSHGGERNSLPIIAW